MLSQTLLLAALICTLGACQSAGRNDHQLHDPMTAVAYALIDVALDDFHGAAAQADSERYFGHLAEHAMFIGTDATERWTKTAFQEFAAPHFERDSAWTYTPVSREITLGPGGVVAWFDELLSHTSYGLVRGSGVLTLKDGAWLIEQYVLSFAIPNAAAETVVEAVRAQENEG